MRIDHSVPSRRLVAAQGVVSRWAVDHSSFEQPVAHAWYQAVVGLDVKRSPLRIAGAPANETFGTAIASFTSMGTEVRHRLEHLDGLRGVAIILVILFHAFARWPELVGAEYADMSLAQGKMGVQLFFLISGFVIFMSLGRSRNAGNFLWHRWLRLLPAMLVVSIFVFVTAPLITRPAGTPVLRDLLPGISLVDPRWWQAIIGSPQGVVEGSFWSLFVEVKFYLFVSLVYFACGSWVAIGSLVAVLLTPFVIGRFTSSAAPFAVAEALGSSHWGWFAGALHYKFMVTRRWWAFGAAIALSLFAAIKTVEQMNTPAAACMALLFAAAQVSGPLQKVLASRVLVFIGFVSYPLYLIHENLMIGMMIPLRAWLPTLLVPILPIAILTFAAWIVARFIEPAIRRGLQALGAKSILAILHV